MHVSTTCTPLLVEKLDSHFLGLLVTSFLSWARLMLRALGNWLFRPVRAATAPLAEPQLATIAALEARLAVAERKLDELALIPLTWAETLDKLQAWTNRQNARDAKRVKAGLDRLSGGPETHEDAPGPTNGLGVDLSRPGIPKSELRRLANLRRAGG